MSRLSLSRHVVRMPSPQLIYLKLFIVKPMSRQAGRRTTAACREHVGPASASANWLGDLGLQRAGRSMNERQTAAKTQRRHWCSNANAIKYYFSHGIWSPVQAELCIKITFKNLRCLLQTSQCRIECRLSKSNTIVIAPYILVRFFARIMYITPSRRFGGPTM